MTGSLGACAATPVVQLLDASDASSLCSMRLLSPRWAANGMIDASSAMNAAVTSALTDVSSSRMANQNEQPRGELLAVRRTARFVRAVRPFD
jgi:hypothetical protein